MNQYHIYEAIGRGKCSVIFFVFVVDDFGLRFTFLFSLVEQVMYSLSLSLTLSVLMDLQTVYKGRKKKTIEYFAIKSVDKSQKSKVLQEVSNLIIHYMFCQVLFCVFFPFSGKLIKIQCLTGCSVKVVINDKSTWLGKLEVNTGCIEYCSLISYWHFFMHFFLLKIDGVLWNWDEQAGLKTFISYNFNSNCSFW